jgi:hypothetical protein
MPLRKPLLSKDHLPADLICLTPKMFSDMIEALNQK